MSISFTPYPIEMEAGYIYTDLVQIDPDAGSSSLTYPYAIYGPSSIDEYGHYIYSVAVYNFMASMMYGNTSGLKYGLVRFNIWDNLQPPSDLTATGIASKKVYLTWTNAPASHGTMIRRSSSGYPATVSSGTLVYMGNASAINDSNGLESVTRYYYRAWAYVNGSTYYSRFFDDAYTSTLPGGEYPGPAVPIIDINTSPEWWYSNLSCADSNIPFREEFITAANKIGCSPCVLITAAAVAVTMAVSVGVFLFVGSIALSFFVGLGMLIGALLTGAVPLWVVLIYGLLGISTYYVLRRA
jgi:hypothetical protein